MWRKLKCVRFILGLVSFVFRSRLGAVELPGPGGAKMVFLQGLLGVNGIAADLRGQLQQLWEHAGKEGRKEGERIRSRKTKANPPNTWWRRLGFHILHQHWSTEHQHAVHLGSGLTENHTAKTRKHYKQVTFTSILADTDGIAIRHGKDHKSTIAGGKPCITWSSQCCFGK